MSTHTFIGVGYYLLTGEFSAFDRHAAKLARRLAPPRSRPRPVLKALRSAGTPGSFDEGLYDLWLGDGGNRALFACGYGDSVLLICVFPPETVDPSDAEVANFQKSFKEANARWKALFASGGDPPPYKCAFVHLVELDGPVDFGGVEFRRFGENGARVRLDRAAPLAPAGLAASGDFLWQLVGADEHLLVSAEDNEWLRYWCFKRAHLFRLLLFHGKADRYAQELERMGELSRRTVRRSRRFPPGRLEDTEQKNLDLQIAVENFESEWKRALGAAGPTPLGDFFARTHRTWRERGLSIWRDIAAAHDLRQPPPEKEKEGARMSTDSEFDELYGALQKRYNLEELRTLCARLGIDFDDLGGEGRAGKARELILRLRRAERLDELRAILRPNKAPVGNAPTGNAPTGNAPAGNAPTGNVPAAAPADEAAGGRVYRYDFFLAHAGPDTQAADDLYVLLAPDARVFLDKRCLRLGDNWDSVLPEAQRISRITVVLVSARTEKAYYQKEEIAAAIDMARKEEHRVVPVYLDGWPSDSAGVPYGLKRLHGLSAPDEGGLLGVSQRLKELLIQLGEADSNGN